MPESSPSKTNILQSSATFRTLTAQKLQRHAASTINMRKSGGLMQTPGMQPTHNPSFGSLNSVEVRATSELQTKSKLNKDRTTLPAVRVR